MAVVSWNHFRKTLGTTALSVNPGLAEMKRFPQQSYFEPLSMPTVDSWLLLRFIEALSVPWIKEVHTFQAPYYHTRTVLFGHQHPALVINSDSEWELRIYHLTLYSYKIDETDYKKKYVSSETVHTSAVVQQLIKVANNSEPKGGNFRKDTALKHKVGCVQSPGAVGSLCSLGYSLHGLVLGPGA